MARYLTSFLLSLTFLETVKAAPKVYPEVIPGPGLPPLAELNLTSAQLYEMGPPDAALFPETVALAGRTAAYVPKCGPADAAYANVNDIIACFHYLRNLGTQRCVATRGMEGNRLCTAGGAQVAALSLSDQQASSYCSDAAVGVLWVIDSCTRPDQSCAGSQAASGNGDLVVAAFNLGWFTGP